MSDGDNYEGDLVDGKRTGKGVIIWENGNKYEGDWVENKRTGKGVYTWKSGNKYEGDFIDGNFHGKGIKTWSNGDKYEGDFVDDKRTGKGVYTWENGDKYEGDFVDDERTGKGVYTHSNGDKYEGESKVIDLLKEFGLSKNSVKAYMALLNLNVHDIRNLIGNGEKANYEFWISFKHVYRKYIEYGTLELLDQSEQEGFFQGNSCEKISYKFILNESNINDYNLLFKKIEDIRNGKDDIVIKFTDLPEFCDEECEVFCWETIADTFHEYDSNKKPVKMDKKLYFAIDVFNSNRWSGTYSSQNYAFDDEMILAHSNSINKNISEMIYNDIPSDFIDFTLEKNFLGNATDPPEIELC